MSIAGEQMLRRLGVDIDYQSLASFFELSTPESIKDTRPRMARTVKVSGRVIGFTVHITMGGSICIFFNDITEKKRLENIAAEANLMENIGYVFSGIRHELGNPVNAVKTAITVLERDRHRLPQDSIDRLLKQTLANIGRMEYLLNGLRGYSLFEEIHSEPVELQAFYRRFLDLASRELSSRGVRVSMLVDKHFSEWVLADERALHQVALNLLSNSLDAFEEQPEPKIDISFTRVNGHAIIAFTDNGCGIPLEHESNLFKPFHTSKPHGNGLGLVITKRLVTSMHGQLDISSVPDEGTTVTIAMPRTQPPSGF